MLPRDARVGWWMRARRSGTRARGITRVGSIVSFVEYHMMRSRLSNM